MLFEKFRMKQRFRSEMHEIVREKEALLKAEMDSMMRESDPVKARHHAEMVAEYARQASIARKMRDMKIIL